ncbi:hypothetical protein IWQ60_008347 [Tieghemiomyces parasiticus]|uniref:Carbohydrate kinase FGGY C-terminal domain-containing protein n=1 Tax=Tieghemiomyces parasiticus TaxID=78921 RepID=A0A9W8A208_9FUNG|nr:hypothetical protein IWQ60_008347 [Tieghemiomyces parasiticus]
MSEPSYYIGVDVGTASVRAALFQVSSGDSGAELVAIRTHPISMQRSMHPVFPVRSAASSSSNNGDQTESAPVTYHYEQCSEEIWRAVVTCVRGCSAEAMLHPGFSVQRVRGIGFDATCSLVVLRPPGPSVSVDSGSLAEPERWVPVPISQAALTKQFGNTTGPALDSSSDLSTEDGKGRLPSSNLYNIVLWMDHRAEDQANRINQSTEGAQRSFRYLGGRVSVEMELPKILWLKEFCRAYEPAASGTAGLWPRMHFFSLPDFLTWRATGNPQRSACSLVCKWGYLPSTSSSASPNAAQDGGWDQAYLQDIGLGDLADDDYIRIGGGGGSRSAQLVSHAGDWVGNLTPHAATELGLPESVRVGSAVIDAYAGWIGTVAATAIPQPGDLIPEPSADPLTHRLAMICGTSSCHLVAQPNPHFVSGVWGPYQSVTVPNLWLNEGGQSATGALLDFIVSSHPAFPVVYHAAETKVRQVTATRPAETDHNQTGLSPAPTAAVYRYLNHMIVQALGREDTCDGKPYTGYLRLVGDARFHVLPDFHGNRSPISDASLRGALVGLDLEPQNTPAALVRYYVAFVLALAYGTRQIIDQLTQGTRLTSATKNMEIDALVLSGGLAHNDFFVQVHADVTGRPVLVPQVPGAAEVLLGAAMCAYAAAQEEGQDLAVLSDATGTSSPVPLVRAMRTMAPTGHLVRPLCTLEDRHIHDRRYRVMCQMQQDQIRYQRIMEGAE